MFRVYMDIGVLLALLAGAGTIGFICGTLARRALPGRRH